MSYTPPLGGAINFVFPGDAYTAPSGDAISFSFSVAVTGEAAVEIVLSAEATGQIVTSGQGQAALLSAYGTNLSAARGKARASLRTQAGAVGSLDVLGGACSVLDLLASGTGYGCVEGDGAKAMTLAALGVGSANAGIGQGVVQISAIAGGSAPTLAVGNVSDFLLASSTGVVGRVGNAFAGIPLFAGAAARHVVGSGTATRLVRGSSAGYVSRQGVALAILRPRGTGSGYRGVAGRAACSLLGASATGSFVRAVQGYGNATDMLSSIAHGRFASTQQMSPSIFVKAVDNSLTVLQ